MKNLLPPGEVLRANEEGEEAWRQECRRERALNAELSRINQRFERDRAKVVERQGALDLREAALDLRECLFNQRQLACAAPRLASSLVKKSLLVAAERRIEHLEKQLQDCRALVVPRSSIQKRVFRSFQ